MTTWSFYHIDTGRFSGRVRRAPKLGRVPVGLGAIEGVFDASTQRVDVETGVVISYQRTAAELEAERRETGRRRARQRIAELERAQLRPLRELAVDETNAEAKRRLQGIEDEIAGLREQLGRVD